jgi:hypothetical protein
MNFEIVEREDGVYEYSTNTLATLIDVYAMSHESRRALTTLMGQFRSFDFIDNIDLDMRRLREATEAIEMIADRMPRYEAADEAAYNRTGVNARATDRAARGATERAGAYSVSAVAVHCARVLIEQFDFFERDDGRVKLSEKNIAITIDVSTHIFRVQDAANHLLSVTRNLENVPYPAQMKVLRRALQMTELSFAAMPSYAENPAATRPWVARHRTLDLTTEQRTNRLRVQRALNAARTPDESVAIMRAAQADKML